MLAGACAGELLVEALPSLPHRDIDIDPLSRRIEMPVREVAL
jgi:hypothetical protein